MSAVSRGNAAELRTAKILQADGWVVGSRRHIPGPGDLLACKAGEPMIRLIEVKAGLAPYMNFRQPDRAEMLVYAINHGLWAELAYWPPGARTHQIIGCDRWPSNAKGGSGVHVGP